MVGGMCGRGGGDGHAWQGGMHGQGVCVAGGGMHSRGSMCGQEGGHAWQGACMGRGVHAMHAHPRHYKIRSVNARVARILLECILV